MKTLIYRTGEKIKYVISKYNFIQIKKIKYNDILYAGDKYEGIFIEGNQYLISSDGQHVYIIDYIGEDMGVDITYTRNSFTLSDFIELMNNKKIVLDYI